MLDMLKLNVENKEEAAGPAPEEFKARAREAAKEIEQLDEELSTLMEDIGEAQALGDHKLAEELQEEAKSLEKKKDTAARKREAAMAALPHAKEKRIEAVFAAGRKRFAEIETKKAKAAERIEQLARDLQDEYRAIEPVMEEELRISGEMKKVARSNGRSVSDVPPPPAWPLPKRFRNALKRFVERVEGLDGDRREEERMKKPYTSRKGNRRRTNVVRSSGELSQRASGSAVY